MGYSTYVVVAVIICNVADRRVGFCFRQLVAGRCTSRTDGLKPVTRADCCCTMGAAWGPHCEICPSPTSDDYQDLCLESGYSVDGHGKRSCNIFDIVSLEAN
jgi:fibulin 1/2